MRSDTITMEAELAEAIEERNVLRAERDQARAEADGLREDWGKAIRESQALIRRVNKAHALLREWDEYARSDIRLAGHTDCDCIACRTALGLTLAERDQARADRDDLGALLANTRADLREAVGLLRQWHGEYTGARGALYIHTAADLSWTNQLTVELLRRLEGNDET